MITRYTLAENLFETIQEAEAHLTRNFRHMYGPSGKPSNHWAVTYMALAKLPKILYSVHQGISEQEFKNFIQGLALTEFDGFEYASNRVPQTIFDAWRYAGLLVKVQ